ncbi:MAG: hypothetical protein ACK4ZV_13725 [Microcystis sp.]
MPTRITKLANCQSGGSEAGEETIFIYSPISHLLTPYTPHPTPHTPHHTPHTPLLQQL